MKHEVCEEESASTEVKHAGEGGSERTNAGMTIQCERARDNVWTNSVMDIQCEGEGNQV